MRKATADPSRRLPHRRAMGPDGAPLRMTAQGLGLAADPEICANLCCPAVIPVHPEPLGH
jgi:hypothetical protein